MSYTLGDCTPITVDNDGVVRALTSAANLLRATGVFSTFAADCDLLIALYTAGVEHKNVDWNVVGKTFLLDASNGWIYLGKALEIASPVLTFIGIGLITDPLAAVLLAVGTLARDAALGRPVSAADFGAAFNPLSKISSDDLDQFGDFSDIVSPDDVNSIQTALQLMPAQPAKPSSTSVKKAASTINALPCGAKLQAKTTALRAARIKAASATMQIQQQQPPPPPIARPRSAVPWVLGGALVVVGGYLALRRRR